MKWFYIPKYCTGSSTCKLRSLRLHMESEPGVKPPCIPGPTEPTVTRRRGGMNAGTGKDGCCLNDSICPIAGPRMPLNAATSKDRPSCERTPLQALRGVRSAPNAEVENTVGGAVECLEWGENRDDGVHLLDPFNRTITPPSPEGSDVLSS